ncbi:hypothetical protein NA57DRAFT_76206 [Rhizodiscina lignyota]|uniref:Zn(2)-C6 fungal-type domain-containing protein n=1 Tax=Rhizodiscina lignyota TaxID=1504668 RepID=A0A9P4IIB5_9PEZI|nr:hypothetical protein NA57DRAFT_76206 [Rhizodiscina lignyota]
MEKKKGRMATNALEQDDGPSSAEQAPANQSFSTNPLDSPEELKSKRTAPDYDQTQAPASTSAHDVHSRARITRACQVCRQRKIKCPGGCPCQPCKTSFHDCVYLEPTRNRPKRRVVTSAHIAALENRLKEMESYINIAAHHRSDASPSDTTHIQIHQFPGSSQSPTDPTHGANNDYRHTDKYVLTQHAIENGEAGYQGYSGDRAFMQLMRDKLRNWPGAEVHGKLRRSAEQLPKLFESDYSLAETVLLPPRDECRALIDAALESHALFPILHWPNFECSLRFLYSIGPSQYTADELRFLPLFYAVLALGCLFSQKDTQKSSRSSAKANGRCLVNLSDGTDETSLQALIFLNLFLIATARAGSCYTYLTHTLTIALRMGLHSSLPRQDDLVRHEVGKRAFWTIKVLVNYVSILAGMPKLLDDENIDQDMPAEVNDVYITKNDISVQPANEVCQIAGMNAYIRLHKILEQVVSHIYPPRGLRKTPDKESASYLVRIETIKGIEQDLDNWMQNVPFGFALGRDTASASLLRTQYLLSVSFARVQLYLYRPFLHYLSKSGANDTSFTLYATACVQACHNILTLSGDVWRRGLVPGCNPTFIHMVFGAIITLIYVLLDPTEWDETEVAVKDIAMGRKFLDTIAQYSENAEKAQAILAAMIALLQKEFVETRKRLQNYESEIADLVAVDPIADDESAARVSNQTVGMEHHGKPWAPPTLSESFSYRPIPTGSMLQSHPPDARYTPFETHILQSPNGAQRRSLSSIGDTNAETVSTQPDLGRTGVQTHSSHLSSQFAFTSVTGSRSGSVPYQENAADLLEARPFSFANNQLGGMWSSMTPFAEQTLDTPNGGDLGMMDMSDANPIDLQQMRELFNSNHLL